jgi:palmitoyl-protein thioesterase
MNAMASALSASDFARRRVIQAQYFRDTSTNAKYQRYLETNVFLPWVNNEGTANERDGASRREALTSLERFTMFMFEFDDMVFPKESSWFGSRVIGGSNRSVIIPYDENDAVYQTLGLASLDADGRLETRLVPNARHMQISLDWFVREVVEKYYSDSGSDAL